MKKLTSMLSALALMTFGAWAQDAAPAVEAVPAEVAAIEAPAVVEAPAPEATPAPVAEEATAVQATTPAAKAQEPDVLPVWEIVAFCVVVVGVIGLGIWKASDGNDADKTRMRRQRKVLPTTSWPAVG